MGYQGNRCQICTGCGRCAPAGILEEGMRVVTSSFCLPVKEAVKKPGRELAVADLGTTTIAVEWYDRQGEKQGEYVCQNPQRVFGADVISRIQAAENPMFRQQMRQSVRRALSEGIESCRRQGGDPEQLIAAGNTTMQYLLLGHDPAPLGRAPFAAEHLSSEKLEIDGLETVTMPGLSAFVGGDIVAGILACGMDREPGISLLVDLGTNGEMVLGNREKLLCCGTAAGPAFEGGGDIWGADMIALTAVLMERGLVDDTGLLAEPYFEQGISIGGVRISQERIRQLQTAKAAIRSGIDILAAAYGLGSLEQVEQVYLAGGFGYFLNVQAAVSLGLIPQKLEGRVTAAGNTALAGAWIYGNSAQGRERAERLCSVAQVLNLAECQGFESGFVDAMYLRRI